MARWHSRGFTVAAVLGVVTLLAAACGGEDATPTVRPPTATPATAATATARPASPTSQPGAATPTTAPQAATATPRPQTTPTAGRAPAPTATAVPAPTPTRAPTSAVADVPGAKIGGQLRRRLRGDAASWDTLREITEQAQLVMQPMHDQLVAMAPKDQSLVVGQLAETWKVSADGLTWTFSVRPGVKFHNGNALTAQDVKFTYEAMITPPKDIPSPFAGFLEAVDSITVPDDRTVVIKLKGIDASFLASISFGQMSIVDKEYTEAQGRDNLRRWPPVGTGPFAGKAGGYVRGVSTEIFRNDAYFVPGRPFLSGMKYFVVPDDGSALAAFLTGQLNIDMPLTVTRAKEARARLGDRLTIQTTPTTSWSNIRMNSKAKPFDDVRVRKAIAYAVDKRGSIEALRQGLGAVGGYIPPQGGWGLTEAELKAEFAGYDTDMAANRAKAKQLLAEAGFPNGFTTVYWVRNEAAFLDPSIIVKGDLEQVGIKGEFVVNERTLYSEVITKSTLGGKTEEWKIAPGGARARGTDPNFAYVASHLPDAPLNYSSLQDRKMQDLFNAQNREADPAKRKLLVRDLERYSLGLYAYTVMYWSVEQYGWHSNIKNHSYHVNSTATLQMRDVWMD